MILEVVLEGEGAPLKVRRIRKVSNVEVGGGYEDNECAVRFWIHRVDFEIIALKCYGPIIGCPGEGVVDSADVISLTAHTLVSRLCNFCCLCCLCVGSEPRSVSYSDCDGAPLRGRAKPYVICSRRRENASVLMAQRVSLDVNGSPKACAPAVSVSISDSFVLNQTNVHPSALCVAYTPFVRFQKQTFYFELFEQ